MNTIAYNLERAIALIQASPEKELDLDCFKSQCGTIHCAAGLLTLDPYFAALGMILQQTPGMYGLPGYFMLSNARKPSTTPCNYQFLDDIFGTHAFAVLFCEFGHGEADQEILQAEGHWDNYSLADIEWGMELDKPCSDKALALARLRHQLATLEVTV